MPHQAIVAINGATYVLNPFYVDAGPDPTDPTGKRRLRHRYVLRHYTYRQTVETTTLLTDSPDSRGGIYPVKYNTPWYGFGMRRISQDKNGKLDPRDKRRFWDSSGVMTHWPSQTTPAILPTADTGELSVIRGSAFFKGSLWGLWFNYAAGPVIHCFSRELTSATDTSWAGGGQVDDAADTTGVAAVDLIAHKDRLVALWATGNADINVAFSTDGITWTQATTDITAGIMSSTVGTSDLDLGLLASVGNELIAVVNHQDNGSVTFYSSTDGGVTMADEAIDIQSSNGPTGVCVYPGIDNADKLLVATENGVYEVNTAPSPWTASLIIPMRSHTDNGRRMVVHNNSVFIPIGANSGEPAGMIRYWVDGEGRHWEVNSSEDSESFWGLAANDGVPSDKLGPIHWLKSTGQFLVAAVGGTAASRNGHVLLHNGKGWHYMAHDSTGNQKLYWADDAEGTLHYAVRTDTGATTSATSTSGLPNAFVNPKAGLTMQYLGDGQYMELPEFDLDIPDENKNILDARIDAVGLGTTSTEYLALAYGLNGAAASTTSLGNFISGTTRLKFGSSAGVSAISIQPRITFYRTDADTSLAAQYRSLTLRMEPRLTELNGYEFEVNVPATAAYNHDPYNLKAVIDALETAKTNATLVTFQYSPIASTYVRVLLDESQEDIQSEVTTDTVTADRPVVAVRVRAEER